jgi:hypothetical protein
MIKAVRKAVATALLLLCVSTTAHALMLPDSCVRYIGSGFNHPGLGSQCFLELMMALTDP